MSSTDQIRTMLRKIGLVLAIVSAGLTFVFGLTTSQYLLLAFVIAIGLACASIGSAYVWPVIMETWRAHGWRAAVVPMLFGVLFTATDLTTNFGAIAWQRGADLQGAQMQNTRYDDSRAQIVENQANVAMWKEHLEKLTAEHAWAATVSADGLKTQAETLQTRIDEERANKGCKKACRALIDEKLKLDERIAIAEQANGLTAKIAATQKIIDESRGKAETVEKAESSTMMMNTSLASMFTLSLEPTEAAQHWTDKGLSWLVAAFFAFGAMGCNIVGYSPSKRRDEDAPATASRGSHTGNQVSVVENMRTALSAEPRVSLRELQGRLSTMAAA